MVAIICGLQTTSSHITLLHAPSCMWLDMGMLHSLHFAISFHRRCSARSGASMWCAPGTCSFYNCAGMVCDLVCAARQGRNRRCITLDLHKEEGRDILRRLSDRVDVLVENFRPGVMEKWGLGPQVSIPSLLKHWTAIERAGDSWPQEITHCSAHP